MRKTILVLISLLSVAGTMTAQVNDVLDIVNADRNKQSGCEGLYRFYEVKAPTPAPAGYKPVYVSHYGRHGSRYAWDRKTYTVVKDVLDRAAAAGCLTERGKKLYGDYNKIHAEALLNCGDLLPLGWDQHHAIAASVYKDMAPAFRKKHKVNMMASGSPRAIVSMGAFGVGLQKCDSRLDIDGNSLHTNLGYVTPNHCPEGYSVQYPERVGMPCGVWEFWAKMVKPEVSLKNILTDVSFIGDVDRQYKFLNQLFTLWCGYRYYSETAFMEDVFDNDQILKMWEAANYEVYHEHVGTKALQKNLIDDIIRRADASIAGGEVVMDARFGHDHVVNALNCLLNINGSAHVCKAPEEVKYWFQNYNTPKAATIIFEFYTKNGKDTIFKVLMNGNEVALPQLEPVSGPYYRWEDFKSWRSRI